MEVNYNVQDLLLFCLLLGHFLILFSIIIFFIHFVASTMMSTLALSASVIVVGV